VAVGVVDFLEAVEVQEENGEGAAVANWCARFGFEKRPASGGSWRARERVADGEMTHLLEEAGIVQESAAESDRVASDGERLREDEGGIEQALRLGGGELRAEVHPGGRVHGAVEGGNPRVPGGDDTRLARRGRSRRAGVAAGSGRLSRDVGKLP